MKRGDILDAVKKTICHDRPDRHGEPENSFPLIAKDWAAYLQRRGLMPEGVSLRPFQVAEMLAVFKGVRDFMNPANGDNKHDQIGYLALAAEMQAAEPKDEGKVFVGEISMNDPSYVEKVAGEGIPYSEVVRETILAPKINVNKITSEISKWDEMIAPEPLNPLFAAFRVIQVVEPGSDYQFPKEAEVDDLIAVESSVSSGSGIWRFTKKRGWVFAGHIQESELEAAKLNVGLFPHFDARNVVEMGAFYRMPNPENYKLGDVLLFVFSEDDGALAFQIKQNPPYERFWHPSGRVSKENVEIARKELAARHQSAQTKKP